MYFITYIPSYYNRKKLMKEMRIVDEFTYKGPLNYKKITTKKTPGTLKCKTMVPPMSI